MSTDLERFMNVIVLVSDVRTVQYGSVVSRSMKDTVSWTTGGIVISNR